MYRFPAYVPPKEAGRHRFADGSVFPAPPPATVVMTGSVPGAAPVPLSETSWGPPEASSKIESVAGPRPPTPPGVVVTLMTHEFPARTATPVVHVVPFAIVKSPELVPVILGVEVIFSVAVPELVTAITSGKLVVPTTCAAKLSEVADKNTAGAAPAPDKLTGRGLPRALSKMLSVAGPRAPPAPGVIVTLMTHELPTGIAAPFVHVVPPAMAKSLALVPAIVGVEVMFSVAVPKFVTVTEWAALVVPTT